jgi:hypothetical protein
MAEHGGYLVPREVHAPAEAADDAVIRIDAAKAPP